MDTEFCHDDVAASRLTCQYVEAARPVPSLIDDVRGGLLNRPRSLPPKYFYDERGSRLFDRICDTEEYYPTRTEDALLAECATAVIDAVRPVDILELGSGTSRKTRRLLDACAEERVFPSYTAFDISEHALCLGARGLLETYDWLNVNLLVGDYEAGFANVPRADGPRLIVFLGSTIGNFEYGHAVAFLADLRGSMNPGDRLLLGADRVKDTAVLNAAYNDRQGLTAAFNLNLLNVLNAETDADFDPRGFDHLAAYNVEEARVEMHLVAKTTQNVRVGAIDAALKIEVGEKILTEISRKFTEESLTTMLNEAGYDIEAHFTPDNQYFSLVLARPTAIT